MGFIPKCCNLKLPTFINNFQSKLKISNCGSCNKIYILVSLQKKIASLSKQNKFSMLWGTLKTTWWYFIIIEEFGSVWFDAYSNSKFSWCNWIVDSATKYELLYHFIIQNKKKESYLLSFLWYATKWMQI